ncbi:MAG TPA: ribonuclease HI [Candidatus Nitrosotenuis sp.]|nr:ribonuclease HI [Candidatus Nitrosotenuis sp.]
MDAIEHLKNITDPNFIPTVDIYTDGACSGNPGPGGWGAVILYQSLETDLSGGESPTTNNRMEMMAAIKALQALPRQCKVNLYTDSMYVRDGITRWMVNWKKNGWKTSDKKAVKNQDLWLELDTLLTQQNIIWHWVRGHDGNEFNERADALARNAIIAQRMNLVL